ncbi:MAG: hypothetical protein V3R81_13255 [Gammaproteobacteria bacterium]
MADGLPDIQRERLVFYESEALDELFVFADWVVGLCSQGMLEAGYAGFKPVQMGKVFFGGHGFTFDMDQPEDLINLIRSGEQEGRLSLEEYRRFENFMAASLAVHLVPNTAEGMTKMRRAAKPATRPTGRPGCLRTPSRARVHYPVLARSCLQSHALGAEPVSSGVGPVEALTGEIDSRRSGLPQYRTTPSVGYNLWSAF